MIYLLLEHLDTDPPRIIYLNAFHFDGGGKALTYKRATSLEIEVTSFFMLESLEAVCLVSRSTWIIYVTF